MFVQRLLARVPQLAAPKDRAYEQVLHIDVPHQGDVGREARGVAGHPWAGEAVLGPVVLVEAGLGGEAGTAVRAEAEKEVGLLILV